MRPRIISVSATLALLPSTAFAHPGHDETATFMHGLVHPLSGADHLLAMVMVGLFAVVAFRVRPKLAVAAPLVAAVALIHGHLHGAEAQGAISFAYVAGFLVATAGLLAAGMLAGRGINRIIRAKLTAT